MPPAHHPASRPARTAVRSASSPYPSQAAARHDLRASNKARARVVSAAASTSFSPVASSSRQVLGEIDWWTVMAGQLPSNSSRTSFASEVSSLASRRLSSSASSFYAASLIEDYYCADVAMASGNSVIEADAMAEGFAMDIDGQLILAAASTALPSSRASSRPSTVSLFCLRLAFILLMTKKLSLVAQIASPCIPFGKSHSHTQLLCRPVSFSVIILSNHPSSVTHLS